MIHRPLPGAAIRATNPGDIVELAAGDYPPIGWGAIANGTPENPTKVIGQPGTRIVHSNGGPCIEQGSPSNITFENIDLVGSVDAAASVFGPGSNVTFRKVNNHGAKRGIVFDTNDNDRRTGDLVEGCKLTGHELVGVFASGADGMRILNNWLQANSQCVYFGQDCGPIALLAGNVGNGGQQATYAIRPGGTIRHNVAFNAHCGIAVGHNDYNFPVQPTADIAENVILSGVGRCIALLLTATKGARLTNNVVAHAQGTGMVPRVLSQERDNFGRGCEGTIETGTQVENWANPTANTTDPLQALYTSRGSPMPVQTGVRAAFSRGGGYVVSQ
jgi:hypothetical protein